MARQITLITIFVVGISVLCSCLTWGDSAGDKPRMLAQLSQSNPEQLAAKAASLSSSFLPEISQLALDMICYRWVCAKSGIKTDIKNLDKITGALCDDLNDKAILWAVQVLRTSSEVKSINLLPPANDPRFEKISGFIREYEVANDYKESSPIEAVKALSNALSICQALQLDLTQGIILKNLADHYLYSMSRFKEAETCYSRAIWVFSAYGNLRLCAGIYDELGTLHTTMNRYSAATENFKLSAQHWALISGTEKDAYRLAGLAYIKAGEAQRAAGNASKALELMADYGLDQLRTWSHATKSYRDLILNLLLVSEVYRERGNSNKAIDLLREAQRAGAAQNDPLLTAGTYYHLSKAYAAAGKDEFAKEALRKRSDALQSAATNARNALNKKDEPNERILSIIETGAKASESLERFDDAVEIWSGLAGLCERHGLLDARISALRSLAASLDRQCARDKSLVVRLEAAMLALKADKRGLVSDIVQEMAQSLIEAGDTQNALEALTELADITRQFDNVRGAAKVLEARGTLLARNGQFKEAARDFGDALARYENMVGDPWSRVEVSIRLADAQSSLGLKEDAMRTLQESQEMIELSYNQENLEPNAVQNHSGLMASLHTALTRSYLRLEKPDDAKKLLVRMKRFPWLSQVLSDLKADSDTTISEFARNLDLMSGNPDDSLPSIGSGEERVLADNWPEFAKTCWMLSVQYQQTYRSLPIPPSELFRRRHWLPKKGVVIEYMFTDSSMIVFICGNSKAICKEIPVTRTQVEKQVSALRQSIKSCEQNLSAGIPVPPISDWSDRSFSETKAPLAELYEMLFAPVADDIGARDLLVFALPQELVGLPMHALVYNKPSGMTAFLGQDYNISYLGEGMLESVIGRDSRGIDISSDRLAIFADPEGNLPGARNEAKTIRGVYVNSQWYVGEKATSANFLEECERSGILHLAAHYRIDPNPAKFELLLAPGTGSDGTITIDELTEIANQHLGLVVLSACNTISSSDPLATGSSRAAEIFFSIVGAKSVMGGLWKVSDEAAWKFMGDFYRSLSKGRSRTEALQQAQMGMIQSGEFSHPFYWACFALYGNPW